MNSTRDTCVLAFDWFHLGKNCFNLIKCVIPLTIYLNLKS